MKRNTIQKQLTLEGVQALDTHPTADELHAWVIKRCPNVSKATVYRILGDLAESGQVRRVAIANAPDRFDHTLHEHPHFFCRDCGRVWDYQLSSPVSPEPKRNPNLNADSIELVLYGQCRECRGA